MHDSLENDGSEHEWDQAENMVTEAFDLYEKGHMKQALDKLSSAIELGPEHSEWYFNAALTLDGLEEYEKAIEFYERALQFNPDDVEILNCLGVNYTRTAQYDLALATFERIEAIDPAFEPSYCNRIIAYTELEQYDKAEQMFYMAQQINPDCALCFYNIGNSLFTQSKYDKAIWCWEKCAALDPKHPQIHFRLAQACWISGQGKRARLEFLTELRHNPTDTEVILDFGLFLLESGDLDAAKEKFTRVLEFDETSAPAAFYLAEVYWTQANLAAAEHWYRKAMQADRHLAGPRLRLAQICQRRNERIASLEFLRDEFDLGVEDNEVLCTMGWMFIQLGVHQDAGRCFLQAMEQDNTSGSIFFGLSVSLAMQSQYQGAWLALRQALRLNPNNPQILLCAGWVCLKLKKWPHALRYVRKCQRIYSTQEPWRSQCRQLKRAIILKKVVSQVENFIHRILGKCV